MCIALGLLVRLAEHDMRLPFSKSFFFSLQAHGYATHEFEVTVERLGVYLPV